MRSQKSRRLTFVSMSGLRVGHEELMALGMQLPGLRKRANALQALPPLGILTLAAMAPEGWTCCMVNDLGQNSIAEVVAEILETEPDVVAFSSLTAAANRAYQIGQLLKAKGITTVIGGLHATAIPEECSNYFDVVVSGDGESSLPRLLGDYEQGHLQSRYHAQTPFDLADSPLPRWEILEDAIAKLGNGNDGDLTRAIPRFTLQTQRGCPWACQFCAASRLLGPVRAKPWERIEAELQQISRYSPRPWIELADDNTFAVDRDPFPLLELLRRFGCRWFSESDWRIAENPALLQAIARSGCRQLLIGVESTVFQYPGMGRKQTEFARCVDALQAIQEAGIVVNACFIVGADSETEASIDRLASFLGEAPFGEVQLTLQTPFPGTGLYRQLHKQGRMLFNDWSNHTLFRVTYQPDVMSPEQLQAAFYRLVAHTFSPSLQGRRDRIVKNIRRTQKNFHKS